MPTIYLITRNEVNAKSLVELSEKFTSITAVVMNANYTAQGLAAYARKLHRQDLIIVDHTGEVSQRGITEGLSWAEAQRLEIGVAVAEISKEVDHPSPTRDGFVAWSPDSLQNPPGLSEVVRLLYREYEGVAARKFSDNSEELLALMRARAISVVATELFCSAQDEVRT